MMDLCQNQKLGTLLAVNRKFETDGIHESFSNLPKPDTAQIKKYGPQLKMNNFDAYQ